jgi:pyrimidine-nucleoside phosphorylase|tara:strand:- start:2169 stop:3452 length:1284 start_codon:yes stop_codon:yes gene_type:complete
LIPASLISKKRDGIDLGKNEIESFFSGYLSGMVTDAQMSAMLMAIYFNGMNEDETFALVEVMLHSGTILDFSKSKRFVADKHSTGGIGDKVSIILAPIMAAAGIKIPMIAGRGLGFTGGTIDKLECIPGFDTSPDLALFNKWVDKSGYSIISQSNEICPADKRIYDLRSKTGTISSIPLICGSIMSKKIAEGISGLVLDIKIGNGTFMKSQDQAIELGSWMKKIGHAFNIKTDIVYTNMDQPLGNYAGLSCEILETIDCLKGSGPDDLMNVTLELGTKLILQSGLVSNRSSAIDLQADIIRSGKGLRTFESSVEIQGGKLDEFYYQTEPKHETFVYPTREGVINNMDTESIGWCLVELGCGIQSKDDTLDKTAGMEFLKKTGDKVNTNDPVYRIFCSNKTALETVSKSLSSTIIVSDKQSNNKPTIY